MPKIKRKKSTPTSTLKLEVTLKFVGKVSTPEELATVVKNVADGIYDTANTSGIAPDDSEFYTDRIVVKHAATGRQEVRDWK